MMKIEGKAAKMSALVGLWRESLLYVAHFKAGFHGFVGSFLPLLSISSKGVRLSVNGMR
jgi:hypothetical protein